MSSGIAPSRERRIKRAYVSRVLDQLANSRLTHLARGDGPERINVVGDWSVFENRLPVRSQPRIFVGQL